jgi:hypothetical protein
MLASLLVLSADSLLFETADSALVACFRVMAGIGRLPTARRPVTSILSIGSVCSSLTCSVFDSSPFSLVSVVSLSLSSLDGLILRRLAAVLLLAVSDDILGLKDEVLVTTRDDVSDTLEVELSDSLPS